MTITGRRRLLTGIGRMGLVLACSQIVASCDRLPFTARAEGQASTRRPRIAWLSAVNARAVRKEYYQWGFFRRLDELGFVDGETIDIESYVPELGRYDAAQITALAAAAVAAQPDVIVAAIESVRALRFETKTIPIVFILDYSPLEAGLVEDLTKPGGNLTGVYFTSPPSIFGKRLELLKEAFPHIERVAVLIAPARMAPNPAQTATPLPWWDELQAAARVLGVMLQPYPISTPAEQNAAFLEMRDAGIQGIVQVGPLVAGYQPIISFQLRAKLPVMYAYRNDAGPVSYAADPNVVFARAADYVAAILHGARPANLPIERITAYELAVNPRFAALLDLTIAQSVLARATRVGFQ